MKIFGDIMYFRDWLNLVESSYEAIYEMSITSVESLQPKDGKWIQYNTYVFNVEGDNCGTKDQPCYTVLIKDNGSVVFDRSNSVADNNAGFGPRVFEGVHYAIWEYIKKNKPSKLTWTPVSKTSINKRTGKIENPEARGKAYEIFAFKSLFPDLYISPQQNLWVRRDIYEKDYVQKGYPAIPENITTNSDIKSKRELLNQIRNKHTEIGHSEQQTNLTSSTEAPQGLEELVSRSQEIYNTGLKIGDFVSPNFDENYIMKRTHGSNFYGQNDRYQIFAQELYEIKSNKGQIVKFYQKIYSGGENNDYYAQVKFIGENENQYKIYVLDIRDIVKYEENNPIVQQFKERAKDLIKSALNSDNYNPHKLAVGMKIIHDQGAVGYIRSIDWVSRSDMRRGLKAEIQWNPQESLRGSEQNISPTIPLQSSDIGMYNNENVRMAQQLIDSRNAANTQKQYNRQYNPLGNIRRQLPTETYE
jgi:hypothetical protein